MTKEPLALLKLFTGCAVFLLMLFLSSPTHLQAQTVSIPESIEWTWEVRPLSPDTKLPNVLLLGDSITRNYAPRVVKELERIANVYLMASSTSVGDSRLARQIEEFASMEGVPFQVVHFNNGMHGWGYTEEQYKAAFPSFLSAVKRIAAPNGILIWSTTTPVTPSASKGATNERIDARNTIADALVMAQDISIDDQHALMLKHQDLHQDPIHFNASGSDLQAAQAVKYIRDALKQLH
jgi:lysophospholipase L1-like esterase